MKWFFFFLFAFSFLGCSNSSSVKIHINTEGAHFTEGTDSILKYQIAKKSYKGTYSRANYIHPLYSLNGTVLTEDFPEDHLHQRGVFWAWHQLYIGKKRIGDGWEIKDFSWEVASVRPVSTNTSAKAIQAEVFWKSNLWLDDNGMQKPFVKEITTITVHPKKINYREIDITISLLALEESLHIGGSENEKGYGGFSPRIKLPDDVTFTSSTGSIEPKNLPVKAGNWMDISGAMEDNGTLSGIAILCHPDNPDPINRWILRSKHSMQNAVYPFPGAQAVPLSTTKPTALKYRLVVHQGNANAIDLETIYQAYTTTKYFR
ncbi:PmoA family protein [Flavobacteriaceae bacterium GSB9]|nr:PmoA family protein [Flavobacteriaceae bacterium GSB9]